MISSSILFLFLAKFKVSIYWTQYSTSWSLMILVSQQSLRANIPTILGQTLSISFSIVKTLYSSRFSSCLSVMKLSPLRLISKSSLFYFLSYNNLFYLCSLFSSIVYWLVNGFWLWLLILPESFLLLLFENRLFFYELWELCFSIF